MSESDGDFIRTLRVVKARDSKIQANRAIWEELLESTFESLLVMCIGTVSNANFELSVQRQLDHNSYRWTQHQNNILNLFLYVSHIGVKYRLFHEVRNLSPREQPARRTPDDSIDYAYYFMSNLKNELMFRVAILMDNFCTRKRMIRIEKVLKFCKRTHIYKNLYGVINLHVGRVLDSIAEQIRITETLYGDMYAPTE